uniref:MSP domain-containing protein n=1 Tax=Ascaris lumbricoides TaxID=6252 RepID=A0A0M3HYW3_ASCLU
MINVMIDPKVYADVYAAAPNDNPLAKICRTVPLKCSMKEGSTLTPTKQYEGDSTDKEEQDNKPSQQLCEVDSVVVKGRKT